AQEVAEAPTLAGDALTNAIAQVAAGGATGERPSRMGGPLAELVGTKLGHYDVDKVLFRGRSSVVFRARDAEGDRDVALKVFLRDLGASEMDRFRRALEPVLKLRHPHLVAMYDVGRTGQHCWVATQCVEGESLTQVIQRVG